MALLPAPCRAPSYWAATKSIRLFSRPRGGPQFRPSSSWLLIQERSNSKRGTRQPIKSKAGSHSVRTKRPGCGHHEKGTTQEDRCRPQSSSNDCAAWSLFIIGRNFRDGGQRKPPEDSTPPPRQKPRATRDPCGRQPRSRSQECSSRSR